MITGAPEVEFRLTINGHEAQDDRIARRRIACDPRPGDPRGPIAGDVNVQFRGGADIGTSVDMVSIGQAGDLAPNQARVQCEIIGALIIRGTAAADQGDHHSLRASTQSRLPKDKLYAEQPPYQHAKLEPKNRKRVGLGAEA